LIGVTAFTNRCIKGISKQKSEVGTFTSVELREAEILWIVYVQQKLFGDVIESIQTQKVNNLQRQLGVFIDPCAILRCKGRLENADFKVRQQDNQLFYQMMKD